MKKKNCSDFKKFINDYLLLILLFLVFCTMLALGICVLAVAYCKEYTAQINTYGYFRNNIYLLNQIGADLTGCSFVGCSCGGLIVMFVYLMLKVFANE